MKVYDKVRDRVLERDVREMLAHDSRGGLTSLDVTVDGGVAHVTGEIRDEDRQRVVRRLLGRVSGVVAVWDILRVAGRDRPVVVDIGCGAAKQWEGSLGIDAVARPGTTDVVADLEHGLPLETASVDHVFAIHVLEHVRDVFVLMDEIHRVLRPSGMLHVMVPEWRHCNAVADPTHVRFFGRETFRHFCEPGERGFEPVTLTTTSDTVFADLERPDDDRWEPFEESLARFFCAY